jgi:ribosomal protein S18 acetylase RimI-like enzyme
LRAEKGLLEFRTDDGRHCVLRRLKQNDLEALLAFANKLVKEKKVNRELGVVSFDRRVTRKKEREWLRGLIEGVKKGEIVSMAAFVGDEMVGHSDIGRRLPDDVRHTGVLGIAILDGYRGVGIGERMMLEAIRQARSLGIELVELQVFAINKVALHLYQKLGFKIVGLVPNKMRRDDRYFDEITMFGDIRGTDKSLTERRRKG